MPFSTRFAPSRGTLPVSVVGRDGGVSGELHHFAHRRLSTALGHFAARVRDVDVWLEDVNGPRRGVDKRCRISLRLKSGGQATATAHAANEFAALARAAERAGAILTRRTTRTWMGRQRRSPGRN